MRSLVKFGSVSLLMLCVASTIRAEAQVAGSEISELLRSQSIGKPSVFERGSDKKKALPVAGWVVFPSLTVGAVADDNVTRSKSSRVSALGARIRPEFRAEMQDGLHDASVGVGGDVMWFDEKSIRDVYSLEGSVSDTYRPSNDVAIRGRLGANRASGTTIGGFAEGVDQTINNALNVKTSMTASVDARKDFVRAFVSGGYALSHARYDAVDFTTGDAVSTSDLNRTTQSVYGRVAYLVVADGYIFSEVGLNNRHFETGLYDSSGYRALFGVGSDRLSLFRGEVFVGRQAQSFVRDEFGTVSYPVFGGTLGWYPAEDLNFFVTYDQTIGERAVTTGGVASPTQVNTFQGGINKEFSRSLRGLIRLGYSQMDNITGKNAGRDVMFASLSLNYAFTRSLGVSLDYRYERSASEGVEDYARNQVLLGIGYTY